MKAHATLLAALFIVAVLANQTVVRDTADVSSSTTDVVANQTEATSSVGSASGSSSTPTSPVEGSASTEDSLTNESENSVPKVDGSSSAEASAAERASEGSTAEESSVEKSTAESDAEADEHENHHRKHHHKDMPHHRKHGDHWHAPPRKERKQRFPKQRHLDNAPHGMRHHHFGRRFDKKAYEQDDKFFWEDVDRDYKSRPERVHKSPERRPRFEDREENDRKRFGGERELRRRPRFEDREENDRKRFGGERELRRKSERDSENFLRRAHYRELDAHGKHASGRHHEKGYASERDTASRQPVSPFTKERSVYRDAHHDSKSTQSTAPKRAPAAAGVERDTPSFFSVLRNFF